MILPAGFIAVGECVEVMHRAIPDDAVDLVLTSPPYDDMRIYDGGYVFHFEYVAAEILRVVRPGGTVVWVVGDKLAGGRTLTSFRHAVKFQELGFDVHDVMIYRKRNTPFPRMGAYTPAWEFMFVLRKPGEPKTFNALTESAVRPGTRGHAPYSKGPDADNSKKREIVQPIDKTRTNVWDYAVGQGGTTNDDFAFEHPAMFPEALATDHILSWSNPGDLVLDPMCGAGTTLKMAEVHNRRWMGIEISPKYAEIARRRVANLQRDLLSAS